MFRILRYAAAMSIISGCAIFTLGAASTESSPSPESRQAILAADGQAKMPIVISANASEGTKRVATELADYLGRISGTTFEVKVGDDSSGILLGTIREFPNASLAESLAIRNTYDGKEAYAIRTEPTRVLLLGATDLGASHAAFAFLERLGCRWFFPAKEWEVVPSIRNLTAAVDETSRPAILSRRIWYAWGCFTGNNNQCQSDYKAWARRNRMDSSFTVVCNHAWQAIITANKEVFEAHPEYLAMVKGVRKGKKLCVSNPEVRELAARHALEYLAKNPGMDMVSMEPSDGEGFCECESCAKLGSVSDQVFTLVNHVARVVAAKYPGKMVGSLAYNRHCEPPSFKLEPNVYVQMATGFITGKRTFDELLDLWPKACPRIGFYDYYSIWQFNLDMPPGEKGGNISVLRKGIPRFAAAGAASLDCESGNNWGPHGRGYYVANRLMWDPKANVDALLADFYEQAFGPAAAAMRRYYERLDPGNDPIMGEPLLALALRDLEEATRLARERPDVQARLDHLKQYMHYVRLMWDLRQVDKKEAVKRQDMTLDVIKYAYRVRYSYMIHWEAVRNYWATQMAKEFNQPEWGSGNRGTKPWQSEQAAPTREETEKLFQGDLVRFQLQPVEEKAFGRDLVPGGFKRGQGACYPTKFDFGGSGVRLALYSQNGEALEMTIITGVIAKYRNRADAEYTLTDPAGTVIRTGRLPQDGIEHPLKLEVPKAGLYWFEFTDRRAGWKVWSNPGFSCSLSLERDPNYSHMGNISRLYFYVPKGTRKIHYFTQFGGGQKVCGPDEKTLHEVAGNGVNVSVTVPDGADGKVWSLSNVHIPNIWFFNVPNYVASSPEALLVPREVAEADGLEARNKTAKDTDK